MLGLETGISAIRASQVGLDTVANNLTNANTPGYHRQVAQLAARHPLELSGLHIGTGVVADRIARVRDEVVGQTINSNISDTSSAQTQLSTLRRIESLFSQGTGSVHDRIQQFFNNLQTLSTRPDDSTMRLTVLESAKSLAGEINSLGRALTNLRSQLAAEARQTVAQINAQSAEIAALNKQIAAAQAQGLGPNDLLDRRDALLDQMAELVDVELQPQPIGPPVVMIGQGTTLIGTNPAELEVVTQPDGSIEVRATGQQTSGPVASGKLAGLLESHSEIVNEFSDRLADFVRGLVQTVDGLHAAGIGSAGSFEILTGHRAVADPSLPLAQSSVNLPVEAGELAISVTDQSSATRTSTSITIDPATQSLQDVAASISTVANLQAVVDAQTNTLRIVAQPGFEFDFAGRLPTQPDSSTLSGTSTVQVSGQYSGLQNDELTFEIVGSGTVGVSSNLAVEARNAAGQSLGIFNIGLGYEPGSALEVAAGVSIALASGTVNTSGTFSVPAVAQADTAGVLAALGLNTFFVGDIPGELAVSPELLANPGRLATASSAEPGDNTNLHRLLAARDSVVFDETNDTLESHLAATTALAGARTKDFQTLEQSLDLLQQTLQAERDRISGVDTNEELVKMLDFQRSFQVAARFITTIDETLQDLINIIR